MQQGQTSVRPRSARRRCAYISQLPTLCRVRDDYFVRNVRRSVVCPHVHTTELTLRKILFLYHSIPFDRIGWCAWAKLNTSPDRPIKSSRGGHLSDLDTTHACPQTYITSQKDCLATSPSRKIALCTPGSVAPRHGSSGTLLAAEKGCEGRKKTTFPDTSMSPKSVVDVAGTLIY